MLCFGVADLIYKRAAAAGIKAGEFLMLQAWIFAPGVTLYAWLTGTLDLQPAALWGALAGLFLFVASYNFVQSLQGGAVSTNAPIFRLNFTLTAALAIVLLGETLTLAKAAGAWPARWSRPGCCSPKPGAKPGKFTCHRSGACCLRDRGDGLHQFLLQSRPAARRGAGDDGCRAGLGVLCAGDTDRLLAQLRLFRIPRRRAGRYAALAALALFGAFVLLLHALVLGPASVLVPVAQMSFVITALFGAAIFRERLDLRKCAGLVAAAAALTLFAVS